MFDYIKGLFQKWYISVAVILELAGILVLPFLGVDVPLIAINTDQAPTAVDIFKKYVPSFEAKILSGTGHVVMWDVTEKFNAVLEESIQEIISSE